MLRSVRLRRELSRTFIELKASQGLIWLETLDRVTVSMVEGDSSEANETTNGNITSSYTNLKFKIDR